MEEIEILSWETLNALRKASAVVETVGNLQSGHSMSVFCTIEEDLMELYYSDTAANCLRRYENREEFDAALEERKEEDGEKPFDEEPAAGGFEEDDLEGDEEEFDVEDESERS